MPEKHALAEHLKAIRKALGQSQIEFSANCGISVESLSLMERGLENPKLETLQKIAAYLGITVAQLLDTSA